MKRYDIETPPYGKGRMEEFEDGQYVEYQEARELLDEAAIFLSLLYKLVNSDSKPVIADLIKRIK
jgi:hypothetical protein